jgi:hypothetical protein
MKNNHKIAKNFATKTDLGLFAPGLTYILRIFDIGQDRPKSSLFSLFTPTPL